MIDDTGHRHQESMRQSPGAQRVVEFPYPLRGVIERIYYMDDEDNKTGQTVVDINLHGGYNTLTKVPLCTTKVNKDHGYEWTPDEGDGVIVQFVGGNWADPIITGYFPLQDNNIQAKKADAPRGKRRYHMKCNKTDVVVDKDGDRITLIHGDETMTVEHNDENPGDWTVVVERDINITAGRNITAVAKGYIHATAGTDIDATAGADVSAKAGANAEVRAAGWAQLVANGPVLVKSNTMLTLKGPRGILIL